MSFINIALPRYVKGLAIDFETLKVFFKKLRRRDLTRAALVAAGALALIFVLVKAYAGYTGVRRLSAAKKAESIAFSVMQDDYLKKKAFVDEAARRASSPGGQPPSAVLEGLAGRAGIKEKIISIKQIDESVEAGYTKKSVEVRLARVDMNSLVNLLYMLESDGRLIFVDEIAIKARFDEPERLDVRIKITAVSKTRS